MLTIVHGGQSGVDRGAHEAAIDNGWPITGYMTRNVRDEYGLIPVDVARYLLPHESILYAARTAANVQTAGMVLIVVRDADDPRATPGTAKTIDLAIERRLPRLIVDPAFDTAQIARWIWRLRRTGTLPLPFEGRPLDPAPMRLLVAGPRESKWPGARIETAGLLRRVGRALAEIAQAPDPKRDLARASR